MDESIEITIGKEWYFRVPYTTQGVDFLSGLVIKTLRVKFKPEQEREQKSSNMKLEKDEIIVKPADEPVESKPLSPRSKFNWEVVAKMSAGYIYNEPLEKVLELYRRSREEPDTQAVVEVLREMYGEHPSKKTIEVYATQYKKYIRDYNVSYAQIRDKNEDSEK